MTANDKNSTPFIKAAVALDAEFGRFESLALELDRLNLDSDRGFERGLGILEELERCRERFGPASQDLARTMEESRAKTAAAAELVGKREAEVRGRKEKVDVLLTRYKALGDLVQKVTTAAAQLKAPAAGTISAEDRAVLDARLPELDTQLESLVEQSRILMDDARNANLKVLERNADSLRQSLQSARHRFKQLVGQFA